MFPVPEILSKFTKSKSNCEDSTQKIPQRSEKTLLSKLRKKEKNRSEKNKNIGGGGELNQGYGATIVSVLNGIGNAKQQKQQNLAIVGSKDFF